VLDHLTDGEGPQTVAEIIRGTGLIRNTAEQAIFRAVQSEQIERIAPGTYRLAPPKPLPPPSPEPPPPSPAGHTDGEWIARIEAWQVNPASWNIEEDGPPPNDPNNRVPRDVIARFKERVRKREERRKDAEAAAAKQAAADAELRNKLLAATAGNYSPGPGIEDLAPVKTILELVPFDVVYRVICRTISKLCYPGNPPLTSWGDRQLLKAIAVEYCEDVIVPSLVAGWGAAKAPGKATGASEPSPAVQAPPQPETAQAVPPVMPAAYPDDDPAIDPATEAPPVRHVGTPEPSRDSILAAFARNRVAPQPVQQPRPAERPWFAPGPEAQPQEAEFSDEAWEEFCVGFRFGTFDWNRHRLGPPPGERGCRCPAEILRRNGIL